jgi:hypothetical protein
MSQLSNEAHVVRAARNLMEAHGPHAAIVAEKRAINLERSGEKVPAKTWRQIAEAVRAMTSGVSAGPCGSAA